MKTFAFIPKNLDLAKKMTILMITIFLVGILVVAMISYKIFVNYAEQDLNARAGILISTLDSVRKYNSDRITPLLKTQSSQVFLQESVPSFATNKVFQIFVNAYKNDYGDYLYKNAMLNPTNVKDDLANSEETKIIGILKQRDEELSKDEKMNNIYQGYSIIDGENFFYIARPVKITSASCLSCHSTLAKVPRSLQALYQQGVYGENNGLNWLLNTVIGAKIVYVPATKVYKIANRNFAIMLSVFIGVFLAVILLTNLWLKKYVVLPINRMTKVAEAVSLGDLEASFEKRANDEIGRLAESFTRLKNSFVIAMKRLTKKDNSSNDN